MPKLFQEDTEYPRSNLQEGESRKVQWELNFLKQLNTKVDGEVVTKAQKNCSCILFVWFVVLVRANKRSFVTNVLAIVSNPPTRNLLENQQSWVAQFLSVVRDCTTRRERRITSGWGDCFQQIRQNSTFSVFDKSPTSNQGTGDLSRSSPLGLWASNAFDDTPLWGIENRFETCQESDVWMHGLLFCTQAVVVPQTYS